MEKIYTSLMYHEIVNQQLTKCSVTPENFKHQMEALMAASISSYVLGEEPKGVHSCLITFDDGHKTNLDAARLLRELGLTGYFYLIKDFSLEDSNYLSVKDIKEISSLGHFIGVHGKSHAHWAKLEGKKLIENLKETKDWIEDLTGREVNTCSAPGGVIDQRTIDCIKDQIPELKYIRTSRYGINHIGDTVLYSIGVKTNYSVNKVLNLAINDPWEMRKLMAYYHTKEFIKPLYHFIKGK